MARSAKVDLPLGSLTQRDARTAEGCPSCDSPRITALAINLTDGTPVDFLSCRLCGFKSWTHAGQQLSVSDVLARSRKAQE